MKKILLALVMTLSFASFIAQAETEKLQGASILQKAPANPLIQQSSNQCAENCLANFQSCIFNPFGPGWTVCEIYFERCMTACGI